MRATQGAAFAVWLAAAPAWAQPAPEGPGSDAAILRDYPDEPAPDVPPGGEPKAGSIPAPDAAASTPLPTAVPAAAPPASPAATALAAALPPPRPLPPQLYYGEDGSLWAVGPEELPYHDGEPVLGGAKA